MYNVLTKEMRLSFTSAEAMDIVKNFILSNKWAKVNYTQDTVLKAMITSSTYGSPFWDTLIAETAKENGVTTVLTENEKDFKKIPGIKIVNPFKQ